jgi:hypothetical protein
MFGIGIPKPRDQGMTSETHRSHVGQIVFASSKIDFGHEDPAAFKAAFTLGEPIYGRMYMAHGMGYTMRDDGWKVPHALYMHVVVDGHDLGAHASKVEFDWTTYNFSLTRGDDDVEWGEELGWFLHEVAPKLAPGDHQVQVVFAAEGGNAQGPTGQEKKEVARGAVTLTVPADRDAQIARAVDKEHQLVAARNAKARREEAKLRAAGLVGVTVTRVGACEARFVDPATASDIGWDAGYYKPGTVVKACENDRCHVIGQVTSEPDQTFTAECD